MKNSLTEEKFINFNYQFQASQEHFTQIIEQWKLDRFPFTKITYIVQPQKNVSVSILLISADMHMNWKKNKKNLLHYRNEKSL